MKYKRFLGYGAIGLTLIAVGVAFIKPISTSNLLFRARALNVTDATVTFTGSNATKSGSTNTTHCDSRSGGDIICKTFYNIPSESAGYIGAVSTDSEIKFYESNGTTEYTFENLRKITFVHGGTSFGFNLIGIYDDGTPFNLTKSALTTSPRTLDFTSLGKVSHLRIKVTSSSTTKLSSIVLTYDCNSKSLVGIEASNPTKTSYSAGESFNPTGMLVKAVYSNDSKVVTEAYTYSPSGSLTTSDTEITVSYKGFSTTVPITVSAAAAISGVYTYTSSGYTWTLDFDNNTYSYSIGSTLNITYSQSGTSITFYYSKGDNTDLGNNRLFDGGSSPVTNATGKVTSNTTLTIKCYNPFGGSNTRTFTKS